MWGEHGNPRSMLHKLQPPEAYILDLIRMALDLELLWAPSDAPGECGHLHDPTGYLCYLARLPPSPRWTV